MRSFVHRRSGFSLVEVTIACSLTAFLAVMLSTTWVLLMRPTTDLIAWGQLFQEMDIAVATLSRDLGGCQLDYEDADSCPGEKTQGLLLAWQSPLTDTDHFSLCFDGGDSPDGIADWGLPHDTVIEYSVVGSSLVRWNKKKYPGDASKAFTVANNVAEMKVTSTATTIEIELTFRIELKLRDVHTGEKRQLTRKCTLIANKKP
jgi:type II secretory pathway component PulJ